MPKPIDSEGTYIFAVMESAIGVTQKNSYPQWVARLKAMKKYIESEADMKHFGLEAPAYVDWSSFDEEILAYVVLFKSADTFTVEGKDRTAMLNYDQLKLALGWDGTEFDSLADGSHLSKLILGRVQEDTYNDKVSLKVQWIDAQDSPPTRTLKSLAPDEVSALSKKLQISAKKPAVAAKPVLPGKPAAAPKAAVPTAVAPPATTQTAPTSTSSTTSPSSPPKPKKTAKAPTPPPPATVVETADDAPKSTTQGDAWEYLQANKGENEDKVVEEAWIAACGEVLEQRDQDTATPEEWAKIRDIALKDLAV